MLDNEPGGGACNFDLPEEVLQVLPSDPFEQLDVARKITSIALSTRISALEFESSSLRAKLAEKDSLVAQLHSQIESLDSSLSETVDKLALAQSEKDNLLKDNAALRNTVRKLQRDVSKLEVFRKTLMQSLQEDEETSTGAPLAKPTPHEDDTTLPPSGTSSMHRQFSETANSSLAEDREPESSRPGISHGMLLASQTSTTQLTPPGTPPSLSASVSPTRTSKPASPRRHSISFSTSRGMFDDRSSLFSSVPSPHSSISSSDAGSQTGRTRVDGKEFFRQVRSQLPYEQFGAFLANVKELNAHKQTKEETLRKADEIFGPENKDLYAVFEGLITRNIH